MSTPREQWGSRYGFVLATIGGAVGIGNIWRFSYVAGENGGAVFLFIYLAFVFLIGIPLMIAELAIGLSASRKPFNSSLSFSETSSERRLAPFVP
jgi:NSS family neurotransmitter:Na+ symporter